MPANRSCQGCKCEMRCSFVGAAGVQQRPWVREESCVGVIWGQSRGRCVSIEIHLGLRGKKSCVLGKKSCVLLPR